MVRRFLPGLWVVLLSGCSSVSYYGQLASGQWQLLQAREPVAKVIADRNTAVLVLGAFAVVQILVHMVFFLHMNGKIEGGWTMLSTIFTVVFVAIAIAGTLWVMFHMNANMMPDHPQIAPAGQQAPAAGGAHHSAP